METDEPFMSDLRECLNIMPLFSSQTSEVDYYFSVWCATHTLAAIHISQNKNIISIVRYGHVSIVLSPTQLTKAPLLFVLSYLSHIIFQIVIEPYPLLYTAHLNEYANCSCIFFFRFALFSIHQLVNCTTQNMMETMGVFFSAPLVFVRWIHRPPVNSPHNNADLIFRLCGFTLAVKQTVEWPVNWDNMTSMWHHRNGETPIR